MRRMILGLYFSYRDAVAPSGRQRSTVNRQPAVNRQPSTVNRPSNCRTLTMKAIRVAVIMDPIEEIKPAKDTTLAMMLAAQRRGWTLLYAEQKDLSLRDGVALAKLCEIKVRDDLKGWFELGEARLEKLADVDAILMRKDPPFDMEYIYTTYILERAEEAGALVVNRPQGLRDINEKVFTAWFPQCCAPTLITRDMRDMHAFLREHLRIV